MGFYAPEAFTGTDGCAARRLVRSLTDRRREKAHSLLTRARTLAGNKVTPAVPATWDAMLLEKFDRYVLPVSLTVVWLFAALFQRLETPALSTELAALIALTPLTYWAFHRRRFAVRHATLLGLSAIPVAVMLVAALRSENPWTAVLGGAPLWQGWLAWATLLGWLVVTVVGSDRKDLRNIARVLATAGTICSVWVALELAGVVAVYDPGMGRAMALFDNPLSLGQALTVTLFATAALLAGRGLRSGWRSWCLVAALVAQVGALAATDARAAWLGVALGVAAYGLLRPGETRRDWVIRGSAAFASLIFFAAFASAALTSGHLLGSDAYHRLDHLLTGRLAIWDSATARVAASPLLGMGPSNFDTVNSWDVTPAGGLDVWMANDAHGILTDWMTSSGLIGLLAFGVAAVTIALHLARVAMSPTSSASVRWLAAGCVACFAAMTTSWADPLSALSVTALVGTIIGAARRPEGVETVAERPTSMMFVPSVALAIAAMAAIVTLWPQLDTYYDLKQAQQQSVAATLQVIDKGESASDDPFYLGQELGALVVAGDTVSSPGQTISLLRELATDYPEDARGRVDIPVLALELTWQHRTAMSPVDYWELTWAFAERGRAVDPTLGVWDYALARAAVDLGRSDADSYIDAALAAQHPVTADPTLQAWDRTWDSPPATVAPR